MSGCSFLLWTLLVPISCSYQVCYSQQHIEPRHGVRIRLATNWQLPGYVEAIDGNSVAVVTRWDIGFGGSIGYQVNLSPKTTLGMNLESENVPYRFTWKGPDELLGPFGGGGEATSTGLPQERWNLNGFGVDVHSILFGSDHKRLVGSIGLMLGSGSGGSTFVWRELQPDSTEMEAFRTDVRFNAERRLVTLIRASIGIEWVLRSYNRLWLGLGARRSLLDDIIKGSYLVAAQSSNPYSGEFRSSIRAIEFSISYTFTWGYPKVPRYWRVIKG